MLPDIGLQPLGYLSSICDKIQDLETMYKNIIVFTHRKATWCRLLYWTSGVFPLCCHLCSKSAIAVICGIINYVGFTSRPLTGHNVDEHNVWGCEAVSHSASVETGIQNHRLFFFQLWPT